MEMSAATRRSLDPTNLNNFVNPLRLPGNEGLFGFLDASDAPVSVMAREERVRVLFRARVRTGLPQPPQQGDGGDHLDEAVCTKGHQGDAAREHPGAYRYDALDHVPSHREPFAYESSAV